MKYFGGMREHADLYRLGGAVFAVILLIVLFMLTRPINQHRHNAILGYFSQLQSDEANLGKSVLELNFSLSNNYDHVNAIYDHMRETVRLLEDGQATSDLKNETKFQQKLHLLDLQLAAQSDVLEQFKSSNAILKNSLIYLPNAKENLEHDLPPGSVMREQLNSLVEKVLLFRIKGVSDSDDELKAVIAIVQKDSARLPAHLRQKVTRLLDHVRNISQITIDMKTLVLQLSSDMETADALDSYLDYYNIQQQRAAAYRIFLLLATLALIAYVMQVALRLRRQTNQLKLAASVFATTSDGIAITDTKGKILEVNPAFMVVTGYSRDEVLGKNPRILQSGRQNQQFYSKMWKAINDSGQWQGEIWNRRKNGMEYPEWLTITTVKDKMGVITNYVGVFSDIAESKAAEEEINQLAFYDHLSGLPNRRLLLDRLQQALASSVRSGREGALLFIDLDNFKTINDTLGHYVGDLLLQQVALRVQSCVREGDTVARLGGDEFVVMLEDLSENSLEAAEQTKTVGSKILASLNQPYQLAENEYRNTPSIGATLFNKHQQSIDELLKQADIAMYQAKKSGRNALHFFDPQMQESINARSILEGELRNAIKSDQFKLYYQVQVDEMGNPLGAEALIRWLHPEKGLVLPDKFIPLAEETGLILPIGQWVIETACAQIKGWESNELTSGLALCVNVSANQFHQQDFVSQVQAIVQRYGIKPNLLTIELTESMLLNNINEIIEAMNALKETGVRFSLDDFGTGYSSLQYLKRLPIDQLKIDKSFVRDIFTGSSDKTIIRTIIAMAHSLGLNVIAEGVESEKQRQFLESSGCSHYQGYLFSRPVTIEKFETSLKTFSERPSF